MHICPARASLSACAYPCTHPSSHGQTHPWHWVHASIIFGPNQLGHQRPSPAQGWHSLLEDITIRKSSKEQGYYVAVTSFDEIGKDSCCEENPEARHLPQI